MFKDIERYFLPFSLMLNEHNTRNNQEKRKFSSQMSDSFIQNNCDCDIFSNTAAISVYQEYIGVKQNPLVVSKPQQTV